MLQRECINVSLSSAEASYFFVRGGNWGEVKSKRAEPGENRNESARGTLGREKERRHETLENVPCIAQEQNHRLPRCNASCESAASNHFLQRRSFRRHVVNIHEEIDLGPDSLENRAPF